ncbi:DUF6221 family protein [Streptomyces sp. NPDC006283]|uniref:DUF6221 family protein n=1 Tax=Streptomyces sp. NPDC006283 TaxID=3156741 RepID=UPI0033B959F7
MNALVQFVRERLDYDEQLARWAEGQSPAWYASSASDEPNNPDRACVVNGKDESITGDTDAGYADHIRTHDPERTLLRVAADRSLVEAYADVADLDTDDPEPSFASGRAVGLGIAVRALAALHSGHRDYQSTWAPR